MRQNGTRFLILLGLLLGLVSVVAGAPRHEPDSLLYMWRGKLYAQAIGAPDLLDLGTAFRGADGAMREGWSFDIYSYANSPLPTAPADGYGFYHGVWSSDRSRFAYLELQPLGQRYRLRLWDGAATQTLIDGEINAGRAYLDPLGWTRAGDLLLLERQSLTHLAALRVWSLALASGEMTPYYNAPLPGVLRGQSAVTTDGNRAFVGFEVVSSTGYLFNFDARRMSGFFTEVVLPEDPGSIFERYPAEIIGVVEADMVQRFATNLRFTEPEAIAHPLPFLYWPLAENERYITCFPDSDWTRENHDVTCPVLRSDYTGHQGTDVSRSSEGGLPRGTTVYPAAPGVVIMTYDDCDESSPSCGDAYGNIIALEHVLSLYGDAEPWLTGYAHLSSVLAEPGHIVRDLTLPIATSGSTGVGGPHLHFEVRRPHALATDRWIDPWDTRPSPQGQTLWMGNDTPVALVAAPDDSASGE